jgi:hypothetical protein
MRRWCVSAATAAVLVALGAPGAVAAGDRLDVYSATVGGKQLGELSEAGLDL